MLSDRVFWEKIKASNLVEFQCRIKYLLTEYGTSLPSNRFDVGISIENLICDHLRSIGFTVVGLPNARKIDLIVNGTYKLSVKYSSTGNITLHNSNGKVNTDMGFTDVLLLTPKKIYLLTNENLPEFVNVIDYLKNKGDSLKLNRSILKTLEMKMFPYTFDIDISVDKKNCKHRLSSDLFYRQFMTEYTASKIEST